MNPLCCIAPVSVEKDPAVLKSQTLRQELVVDGNCLSFNNNSNVILQPVSFNSRMSLSNNGGGDLLAEKCDESDEIKSVAGILYKWVNYGKGWRERWFVLEDGVLSYYKVHGPDKIVVGPVREKGTRVIGQESWRYMRKGSSGNGNGSGSGTGNALGSGKQWKPFGEIHLKVGSFLLLVIQCVLYNCYLILSWHLMFGSYGKEAMPSEPGAHFSCEVY